MMRMYGLASSRSSFFPPCINNQKTERHIRKMKRRIIKEFTHFFSIDSEDVAIKMLRAG
jgi:hypothetical protein